MSTRNPPGTGVLQLAAAILLIGGPILAMIFRSWGVGALVFGLGSILLSIRQARLGEHRSERFIEVALLLAARSPWWTVWSACCSGRKEASEPTRDTGRNR